MIWLGFGAPLQPGRSPSFSHGENEYSSNSSPDLNLMLRMNMSQLQHSALLPWALFPCGGVLLWGARLRSHDLLSIHAMLAVLVRDK